MGTTYETTTELTTIHCGECGGTYAISERYRAKKHESGGYWTCPYCRCGWGYGESETDRIKKEAARAKEEAKWQADRANRLRVEAEHNAARARGYKGAMVKAKKKLDRVEKGVCPECNRTFQNLARHMETQHAHDRGS